jgi:hypothetical protein
MEDSKGTSPSRESKIGKILSVELARDNESFSSKAHNFFIRCLIEVPFSPKWRKYRDTYIKINKHAIP